VLLCGPAVAQQPAPKAFPPDSAVLEIIRQRVAEKRASGIVVGLLEPDGRVRVVAFGDPGPRQPPLDGNSVFEIGSITKVFTATVLAELVNEGRAKLDDPVETYLPSGVHVPSRNGKSITLGTLSSQNSGLPRMPSNFHPADASNPFADYSVQQLYDFLSGYQLTRDPGEKFEYSNLGVGLLGHALSLRVGKSYEEMERDRVWKPLGMTHTAITMTPYMKQHLALGHDDAGKVVPNWDLSSLAGAGAIRSTTLDMLKFLSANLHAERGPLERAMELAHQSRAPVAPPNMMIGLNWLIQRTPGGTVIWHNGGTAGYRTFAGIEPSRKIGVVIMTNSGGMGSDDIGMHLLDPQMPLMPNPTPVKQRIAVDVSTAVLTKYVGLYQLAPAFSIDVQLKNGALYLQATGQDAFRLWAETPVDFFLREVDAQVTFVADSQGQVTGLTLHQNGVNAPATKVK
jgi:CubicO group peptidase (beta-lactamase class C family)